MNRPLTTTEALALAHQEGQQLSARGLRKALASGYIPGARRYGRDWLMPLEGLMAYLHNRPKRGPKPKPR